MKFSKYNNTSDFSNQSVFKRDLELYPNHYFMVFKELKIYSESLYNLYSLNKQIQKLPKNNLNGYESVS
jgi:hypothetical protein